MGRSAQEVGWFGDATRAALETSRASGAEPRGRVGEERGVLESRGEAFEWFKCFFLLLLFLYGAKGNSYRCINLSVS